MKKIKLIFLGLFLYGALSAQFYNIEWLATADSTYTLSFDNYVRNVICHFQADTQSAGTEDATFSIEVGNECKGDSVYRWSTFSDLNNFVLPMVINQDTSVTFYHNDVLFDKMRFVFAKNNADSIKIKLNIRIK